MLASKKNAHISGKILLNKRAKHKYFIDRKFEGGIALLGWEVKSLREGKAQLSDSYVVIHQDEAWLVGVHIVPLLNTSTHMEHDPLRQRKLLLKRNEIDRITQGTEQKGGTCTLMALYWKSNKIKCEIALVTGKKDHDKRRVERDRDWTRCSKRLMKNKVQHSDRSSAIA